SGPDWPFTCKPREKKLAASAVREVTSAVVLPAFDANESSGPPTRRRPDPGLPTGKATVISTVGLHAGGIPVSPDHVESRALTETRIVPDDVESAASMPYFQRDGSLYVPTGIARGGWGPSLSGHVVGGLLGCAVERAVDDEQLQPARLTVDLPAPTAL